MLAPQQSQQVKHTAKKVWEKTNEKKTYASFVRLPASIVSGTLVYTSLGVKFYQWRKQFSNAAATTQKEFKWNPQGDSNS